MAKGATMMDGICPMSVQGTTVTASDIDGGIALTFVTPTGDVSELRRRVHRMAEMHETGCGIMGQRGTMMAGRKMSDSTSGSAIASADDVDHGARLVLEPADPGQLGSFREQVRVCVEHLKRGECPMTMPSTESSDERGRPHRASP
jgi:hypothetical protein